MGRPLNGVAIMKIDIIAINLACPALQLRQVDIQYFAGVCIL